MYAVFGPWLARMKRPSLYSDLHLFYPYNLLKNVFYDVSVNNMLLIFRWTFLISLGFFSLYGVLMIQASSYRMELMMCVLTLFSITMLCYIVADLDSPFSGFFRIDISIIVDVIYRLEVMYKMAAMGFEETVCYPDSSRFTQKKYDDTDSLETSLNVRNVC